MFEWKLEEIGCENKKKLTARLTNRNDYTVNRGIEKKSFLVI